MQNLERELFARRHQSTVLEAYMNYRKIEDNVEDWLTKG